MKKIVPFFYLMEPIGNLLRKEHELDDKSLEINTIPNSFFTIGNLPPFGDFFKYFTFGLAKAVVIYPGKKNKTSPCYYNVLFISGIHNYSDATQSSGIYVFTDAISYSEILYYRINNTIPMGKKLFRYSKCNATSRSPNLHQSKCGNNTRY